MCLCDPGSQIKIPGEKGICLLLVKNKVPGRLVTWDYKFLLGFHLACECSVKKSAVSTFNLSTYIIFYFNIVTVMFTWSVKKCNIDKCFQDNTEFNKI